MTVQDVAALALVAFAAGYLLRGLWKTFAKGASKCGDCPAGGTKNSESVVQIELRRDLKQ